MNILDEGGVSASNRIVDFEAGTVFRFSGSTKGNNGICYRLKDSKNGKGRFTNLENGKVLTASDGDVGTVTDHELVVY